MPEERNQEHEMGSMWLSAWLTVTDCRLPGGSRMVNAPMWSACTGAVPCFCIDPSGSVEFCSNVTQGADMEEANPGGWALQCGQNFSVNHAPSNIDFAAIHVWPDNWERCVHSWCLLPPIAVDPGHVQSTSKIHCALSGGQLTSCSHMVDASATRQVLLHCGQQHMLQHKRSTSEHVHTLTSESLALP